MVSYKSNIEITEEKYLEMCNNPVGKSAKKKLSAWKAVQIACMAIAAANATIAFYIKSTAIGVISIMFAVAFAYKFFIQRTSRNKKQYATIRSQQTEEKWMRTITFADKITVEEANSTTTFKYSDFRWVSEDEINYLLFKNENVALRVEKGSFVIGDEANFKNWISNKIKWKENAEKTKRYSRFVH